MRLFVQRRGPENELSIYRRFEIDFFFAFCAFFFARRDVAQDRFRPGDKKKMAHAGGVDFSRTNESISM